MDFTPVSPTRRDAHDANSCRFMRRKTPVAVWMTDTFKQSPAHSEDIPLTARVNNKTGVRAEAGILSREPGTGAVFELFCRPGA